MKEKLIQLKSLLTPIHEAIGLRDAWWSGVKEICDKLINTYNGAPDTDWWSRIFTHHENHGSGPRDTYDGWFISQLLGLGSVHSLKKLQNGIVTVPMEITDSATGVSEDSAFAAGVAGFEMLNEKDGEWQSVKAVHGWVLMLEPNSVHRKGMTNWENKLLKGA